MVKDIFLELEKVKEVNKTFVSLIPKVDHSEHIKQFRPISLCNVIYKVVTKIISNGFWAIMPSIISPNQCSFVPGRQGTDNIIIAQEVIHKMRSMHGKMSFMAIKFDLEKTYDRLN